MRLAGGCARKRSLSPDRLRTGFQKQLRFMGYEGDITDKILHIGSKSASYEEEALSV